MHADLIVYFPVEFFNTYDLVGRLSNDPIEHRFSLNRSISGHHLALDVASFIQNERTLSFQLIAKLHTNANGNGNKQSHSSFFESASAMVSVLDHKEIKKLAEK